MSKKQKKSKKNKSTEVLDKTTVSLAKENAVAQIESNEKTFPRKKLPTMMKKAMTSRAFEKKLLSKLYVEDDRKFVKSLFTEEFQKGKKKQKTLVRIPLGKEFSKSEIKRLKELSKQIKKNKGRIKFVPLLACASVIAVIAIVVGLFKNIVAKKAIIAACETIFYAKTDISRVRVKLLGISLKIDGIAIGNKNDVMKNLFEAENITMQVNLTQALRGKFVAEDFSVNGMRFGTDRKTSCELDRKTVIENIADSAFVQSLKVKSQKAIEDLKNQATNMLGGSSPEEIFENLQSQLKTPLAAQNAKNGALELSQKWQEKPAEMKTQVEEFAENVKDLQTLDLNSIAKGEDIKTRVSALKDALEKINAAITTGNELKSTFETTVDEVKSDSKRIETLSTAVVEAVKADGELAKGIVGNAVDTVKNAKQLFTNALDTVGYDTLGKYYPYVKQGIDYGLQMKKNAAADSASKSGEKSSKEKEKKAEKGRLKGTTLWFSKEMPSILIKHIAASGYTDNESNKGFSGAIEELTNNQDLRGKPTTATLSFDLGDVNHSGNVILDARSYSKDPLLSVAYTGRGFSAQIDGQNIASASGVPSIDGKADISLTGHGGADGFSATGTVLLDPVTLSSDGFSNETVTKYYKQALATVDSLALSFTAGYTQSNGVDLALSV